MDGITDLQVMECDSASQAQSVALLSLNSGKLSYRFGDEQEGICQNDQKIDQGKDQV
jgi:hypothetical protein